MKYDLMAVCIAALMACGKQEDYSCPTVPDKAGEGFDLSVELQWEIDDDIRDEFDNSDSYLPGDITGSSAFARQRADDSWYYTMLKVQFKDDRGEHAVGVELVENSEGICETGRIFVGEFFQ